MKFGRADCPGGGDGQACRRMKAAVWVDLVGMLLWFATFVGEFAFSSFPLSCFFFTSFFFFFSPFCGGVGLWLIGGFFPSFSLGGGVMWWKDRHGRRIYTGRGSVV